jgi:hypothetical protein
MKTLNSMKVNYWINQWKQKQCFEQEAQQEIFKQEIVERIKSPVSLEQVCDMGEWSLLKSYESVTSMH